MRGGCEYWPQCCMWAYLRSHAHLPTPPSHARTLFRSKEAADALSAIAFGGRTWSEVCTAAQGNRRNCCTEVLVHNRAILTYPKSLYQALLNEIEHSQFADDYLWGWAWEYIMPTLFDAISVEGILGNDTILMFSDVAASASGAGERTLIRAEAELPDASDSDTTFFPPKTGTQCGATQEEWVVAWTATKTIAKPSRCRRSCLADATCTGIVYGTFNGIENNCIRCTSVSTASSAAGCVWATYQARIVVIVNNSTN